MWKVQNILKNLEELLLQRDSKLSDTEDLKIQIYSAFVKASALCVEIFSGKGEY